MALKAGYPHRQGPDVNQFPGVPNISKPDAQIAVQVVQNMDLSRPIFENSCPVFVDYCRGVRKKGAQIT